MPIYLRAQYNRKLVNEANWRQWWISDMTQNACDKTNTFPKMKNCAEYTTICIHDLAWGILLEISNEIAKRIQRKEILSTNLQQWVEEMGFDNGQQ